MFYCFQDLEANLHLRNLEKMKKQQVSADSKVSISVESFSNYALGIDPFSNLHLEQTSLKASRFSLAIENLARQIFLR